ncbi:18007_t:CDS:2, partial [Cetraspora pellucida]
NGEKEVNICSIGSGKKEGGGIFEEVHVRDQLHQLFPEAKAALFASNEKSGPYGDGIGRTTQARLDENTFKPKNDNGGREIKIGVTKNHEANEQILLANHHVAEIDAHLDDMKKNRPAYYVACDKDCDICGVKLCCHFEEENKNNQLTDTEKSQLLQYFLQNGIQKITIENGKLDSEQQKYHQTLEKLPTQSLSLSELQNNNTNSNSNKDDKSFYKGLAVGAVNKIVGREAASKIVDLLRGKNRTDFTPHLDLGNYVVLINARHISFTGNKLDNKNYYNHSGYSGGLRTRSTRSMLEKYPTELDRENWGKRRAKISNLDISQQELDGPLKLERFNQLETFDCSHNNLISLNLTRNKHLKEINCSHNNLAGLAIGSNSHLTRLDEKLTGEDLGHAQILAELALFDEKFENSQACQVNKLGKEFNVALKILQGGKEKQENNSQNFREEKEKLIREINELKKELEDLRIENENYKEANVLIREKYERIMDENPQLRNAEQLESLLTESTEKYQAQIQINSKK